MTSSKELAETIARIENIATVLDRLDLESLDDSKVAKLEAPTEFTANEKAGLNAIKSIVKNGGRNVLAAIKNGEARYGVDETGSIRVFTPADEEYNSVIDYRTPSEALHFQPGIDNVVEDRYPSRTPLGAVAGAEFAPRSQHTVFGGDPLLENKKSGAADVVQDVIGQGTKLVAPTIASVTGGSPLAVLTKTLVPLAVTMGANKGVDVARGEENYSDDLKQMALTAGAGTGAAVVANKLFNGGMHELTRSELATLLAQKLNYKDAKSMEKANPGLVDKVQQSLKSGSMSLYSKRDWVNQPLVDFDKATGAPDAKVYIKPFKDLTDPITGQRLPRTAGFKVSNDILHSFMRENNLPLSGPGSLSDPEREDLRAWLQRSWSDPWSDAGRLFFPQDEIVKTPAPEQSPTIEVETSTKRLTNDPGHGAVVKKDSPFKDPKYHGKPTAEVVAYTNPVNVPKPVEVPADVLLREGTGNTITKADLVKRLGIYDKFELGRTGSGYWMSQFLRDRASLADPVLQAKWVDALKQSKEREGYKFNETHNGPRLGIESKGAPVVTNRETPLVSPREYRQLPTHRVAKGIARFLLPAVATTVAELNRQEIFDIVKKLFGGNK